MALMNGAHVALLSVEIITIMQVIICALAYNYTNYNLHA